MKNRIITAMAVFVFLFLALGLEANAKENATMHCYYNATLREYLYTISTEERNSLDSNWIYKGEVCTVPYVSNSPVYKLLNTRTGQHLYSGVEEEIVQLIADGWLKEGVAFYADDAMTTPVYRLLNSATGEHQFSGSDKSVNNWVVEGVAFYAITANEMNASQSSNTTSSTVFGNTGNSVTASDLKNTVITASKQSILEFASKDYDSDGSLEGFAVTGSASTEQEYHEGASDCYDGCKLWFVNNQGATLIKNLKGFVKTGQDGTFADGTKAFIVDEWYSAHDYSSTVYVVIGGKYKDLGTYITAGVSVSGLLHSELFGFGEYVEFKEYQYSGGTLKLVKQSKVRKTDY